MVPAKVEPDAYKCVYIEIKCLELCDQITNVVWYVLQAILVQYLAISPVIWADVLSCSVKLWVISITKMNEVFDF
eukprot:Gb_35427 [translate_table: standard]